LDNGVIAVAEVLASEIRLFDAAGTHVRSMGSRGRGPGEFQAITALFRRAGDSLAAYDPRERRITVFSLDSGAPRTVHSDAMPSSRGTFDAFGAFGDGTLVLHNPGSSFHPELKPGLQWVPSEVVVLSPHDGSSRVVARLPSRHQFVLDGGDTKRLEPAHGSIRAATADGFYWGTSDRYQITYFDTHGTVRRILRRPVEPRAVLPAMTEQWIAQDLEQVRQREGEQGVARRRQTYADNAIGETLPLFESAFVDQNGWLWVGSSEWPALQAASRTWSLFDSTGVWLGDVDAPAGLRIVDRLDDRVLGIWQEEGEAPYVQVHRLRLP
jgi:hypothetical protein